MKHISIFLFLFSIISFNGIAQENLQSYTPSILFSKGQAELKIFNNLYTQTKSFNSSGKKESTGSRASYFTNINQFLYGINSKINVGFDVWIKSVRNDDENSSAFKILSFKDTPNSRTAVTGFGPKIKIAPFKKLKRFSLQSTFLFPIGKDFEGREPNAEKSGLFLETDRRLWINDFFYDVQLNSKFNLFFKASAWTSFPRDSRFSKTAIETPFDIFASYFHTSRLTFYAQVGYWAKHFKFDKNNEQSGAAFNAYFMQGGLGGKYQIIPNRLELEALYTNFFAGSEVEGAGQTFNIGIRFIKQ